MHPKEVVGVGHEVGRLTNLSLFKLLRFKCFNLKVTRLDFLEGSSSDLEIGAVIVLYIFATKVISGNDQAFESKLHILTTSQADLHLWDQGITDQDGDMFCQTLWSSPGQSRSR